MARKKKSTPEVENVLPYLEGVAKNLVERIYGLDGPRWGTTMTELEDTVVAIRQALSEKMLSQALARQASTTERPEAYQRCSGCGGPVQPQDLEPRVVQTKGGEATWSEPHDYCRKCRQSFFPSVQEPGTGSERIQSADDGQNCLRGGE